MGARDRHEGGRGAVTSDPQDLPEIEGPEDSWEPPHPTLGGPGQLLAAVVVAFLVAATLIGAVAAVTWVFR
jgi:hypothetical protein